MKISPGQGLPITDYRPAGRLPDYWITDYWVAGRLPDYWITDYRAERPPQITGLLITGWSGHLRLLDYRLLAGVL